MGLWLWMLWQNGTPCHFIIIIYFFPLTNWTRLIMCDDLFKVGNCSSKMAEVNWWCERSCCFEDMCWLLRDGAEMFRVPVRGMSLLRREEWRKWAVSRRCDLCLPCMTWRGEWGCSCEAVAEALYRGCRQRCSEVRFSYRLMTVFLETCCTRSSCYLIATSNEDNGTGYGLDALAVHAHEPQVDTHTRTCTHIHARKQSRSFLTVLNIWNMCKSGNWVVNCLYWWICSDTVVRCT